MYLSLNYVIATEIPLYYADGESAYKMDYNNSTYYAADYFSIRRPHQKDTDMQ